MFLSDNDINLSSREIKKILHDAEKSAAAVQLIYVSDQQPGIKRVKKGKSFSYVSGSKKVSDAETLQRIKKLVIPPAWQNVWICTLDNGHLQATGVDIKNRKQYKYHALWNSLRNHTKFYRLHSFGKAIPSMRKQLESDLALPGLPLQKVLATVVCLMEQTSIRVGNSLYEKLYGSFGLTTLKDQHVSIRGNQLQFIFKGKKGVKHNISIKSKRLAAIVKKCRDIPGKELFQYIDDNGNHHCIDSGMVNSYLKQISGEDFTAKDFRTWSGSVHAIGAFECLGYSETQTGMKKNIVQALDSVAKYLGNTRSVCKKYYVHPAVISLYEQKTLHSYLKPRSSADKQQEHDLCREEKVLMKILEKEMAR